MFTTRRKKNYRTFICAAIIVTLCLLIVVIAWPQENGGQSEVLQGSANVNADAKDNPENRNPFKDEEDYDSGTDADDNSSEDAEKFNMSNGGATYYLIKRAGDRIKVFFIDEQGNQIELETTDIIYDVLSIDDQKLFDEGYKVNNQEELAVLLQDFES